MENISPLAKCINMDINGVAGISCFSPQPFEQWDKCIQINLTASMAVCQHSIPYLEMNESSASKINFPHNIYLMFNCNFQV